jgi:hypothetical protein
VDPFKSEEALWEFENLFVLTGDTEGRWQGVSTRFERLKSSGLEMPHEEIAKEILSEATNFVRYTSDIPLRVSVRVA